MNDLEKPGQDAEVFVKAVKRKTRMYFGAEEKIRIVVEGMKRDVSVAELCRREGIPSAAYYSWTKDFMVRKKPLSGFSFPRASPARTGAGTAIVSAWSVMPGFRACRPAKTSLFASSNMAQPMASDWPA